MKVISVRDLILAEPLIGMNHFDVCHPDNQAIVYDVLATLGFDINKPVHIYAANHRDMQNKTGVGYLFAGELNLKREFIKGPYSRPEDVMIAASLQDKSLFEHLYDMSTTCTAYGGDMALDENLPQRAEDRVYHKSNAAYSEEYKNEEERIQNEIAQLEDILYHILGSQRKSDGSVKCLEDYRCPEVLPKPRRKKKRKDKLEGS